MTANMCAGHERNAMRSGERKGERNYKKRRRNCERRTTKRDTRLAARQLSKICISPLFLRFSGFSLLFLSRCISQKSQMGSRVRFEFQLKCLSWHLLAEHGGCSSAPALHNPQVLFGQKKKRYHQREIAEIGAPSHANDAAQRPKVKAKTRTHISILRYVMVSKRYIRHLHT